MRRWIERVIGFLIGILWMAEIHAQGFFFGTGITALFLVVCNIIKRYTGEWLGGGFDSSDISKNISVTNSLRKK
jgi:hypothetical protein